MVKYNNWGLVVRLHFRKAGWANFSPIKREIYFLT